MCSQHSLKFEETQTHGIPVKDLTYRLKLSFFAFFALQVINSTNISEFNLFKFDGILFRHLIYFLFFLCFSNNNFWFRRRKSFCQRHHGQVLMRHSVMNFNTCSADLTLLLKDWKRVQVFWYHSSFLSWKDSFSKTMRSQNLINPVKDLWIILNSVEKQKKHGL